MVSPAPTLALAKQWESRKMVPTRLQSWRVLQQAPAPQTDTLKLENESLSHRVWAPGWVSLHAAPLRAVPQSTQLPRSPGATAMFVFKSQILRALISQVPVFKVGLPNVGYEPLAPQEEAPGFEFPPGCESGCWLLSFWWDCQPLLPASMGFPSHWLHAKSHLNTELRH